MGLVCQTCGLVKELCVCETIAKESQKITVFLERKKFNKFYTIVKGIDDKEIDLKDLAKTLKSMLACGGTIKNKQIELQGDHRQKTKEILLKYGFLASTVEIR
ncbi:translation initiation factor [Candidatus Woesearchaeota archaeon]|nr:translation initiation factor [Candidatus Woesearchaeota archaeon]MBI2130923.1 translation initiation factor [Candidatus Woesearchaeota archaeon]MBI2660969.1 translation initiation factor [Candidatus Woesearchaeota archaeon]